METPEADGDVSTIVERNLDSILEETVEEIAAETTATAEDVIEANRRVDTPDVVESTRASATPVKKERLIRKKRKRSSSEDSSVAEPTPDDEAGPLSNVNKEINVGDDYQAKIVDLSDADRKAYMEGSDSEEIVMWEVPNETMDMDRLTKWAKEMSERFLMPIDRVLFILKTKNFNYNEAYKLISTRPEVDEEWDEEESHIFDRCFSNFGKNFPSIAGGLRHRSVRSIVKHYYNSKKWIKYKQFASSKMNDSKMDEYEDKVLPESMFETMCENCAERVDHLELAHPNAKRLECLLCTNFYKQTGHTRPTQLLLVLEERVHNSNRCPPAFLGYMKDFNRMMTPATGETFRRRKMGDDQVVEDIVGDLAYESPPLTRRWRERIQAMGLNGNFAPASSNPRHSSDSPMMIRATLNGSSLLKQNGRENGVKNGFAVENGTESPKPETSSPELPKEETELPMEVTTNLTNGSNESLEASSSSNSTEATTEKKTEEPVPATSSAAPNGPKVEVWRRKKTLCMEEIEVLANDSRRKMYDACQYGSRVSIKNVERMKQDMTNLRARMEKINFDLDLAPSFILSEEQGSATEWAESHREEALKCFRWYGPKFREISQILGHKSMEQVCRFYYDNREVIDTAIADFENEMNAKVKGHEERVKARAGAQK